MQVSTSRVSGAILLAVILVTTSPAVFIEADATSGPYPFNWPVTGTITRGVTSTHEGVDIAAPEGRHVGAARGGIVHLKVTGCQVGNRDCGGGYGNHIVIRHGQCDHYTLYAHLSVVAALAVGESVNKDRYLGQVGNTGGSDGNHLHFEILRDTSVHPYNANPRTIPIDDTTVVRNTEIPKHYDPCG